MTLTYYPNLPLIETKKALGVLKQLGLTTGNISALTGYSVPIILRWTRDSSNMTEPARQRVSELAYRAMLANKINCLPLIDPITGKRPSQQSLMDALRDQRIDLRSVNPEELIGQTENANQ